MDRVSVAALLVALVACDKGAPDTRLFTDEELAPLEAKARSLGPPAPTNLGKLSDDDDKTRALMTKDPAQGIFELAVYLANDQMLESLRTRRDAAERASHFDVMLGTALDVLPRATFTPERLDQIVFLLGHALEIGQASRQDMAWQSNYMRQLVVFGEPGVKPLTDKDQRGLYLAAMNRMDELENSLCSGTLADCAKQLKSNELPYVEAKALLAEHAAEIRATKDAAARHKLQATLADRFARGLLTPHRYAAAWRGTMLTRLFALRVGIEARKTGGCSMQDRYANIFGEALTTTTHDKILEIMPPTWAAGPNRNPVQVTCP